MLEDLDVVLCPLPTSYFTDEDENLDEALDTIGTECEAGIEEDLLDDDDEDLPEVEDEKKRNDEDDEDYDEDKLTEESYRTTFDTNPEELDIQADEVGDDDDF